jgi:hypothetical protein
VVDPIHTNDAAMNQRFQIISLPLHYRSKVIPPPLDLACMISDAEKPECSPQFKIRELISAIDGRNQIIFPTISNQWIGKERREPCSSPPLQNALGIRETFGSPFGLTAQPTTMRLKKANR